jgi:hypothetical protein
MSRWQFYPLADHPRSGVLKSPSGELRPVSYLTVEEAREEAKIIRANQTAAQPECWHCLNDRLCPFKLSCPKKIAA